MIGLVLSVFPGMGLLDMAFEEAGFCVVRGPDLLWGGDVHHFHPPRGRFDGIIGGPPCQFASSLTHLGRAVGHAIAENLIPQFERIVAEAQVDWFAMENVVQAPTPVVSGYRVTETILRDVWCGGETMRKRRISLGSSRGLSLPIIGEALHRPDPELAVTSVAREDRFGRPKHIIAGKERICSTRGPRLPVPEMARRQGLPPHFFGPATPFTVEAQRKMIANGVPLAMGRAIAATMKNALLSTEQAA